MTFKIIIADDHPLVLSGLRNLIETITPRCDITGEAHSVSELLTLLKSQNCDLLVTDFSMPNDSQSDGLTLIKLLRRTYPNLSIILFTQMQNPALLQTLLKEGVNGVILKSSLIDELKDAIVKVLSGHIYTGKTVQRLFINRDLYPHKAQRLSPKETEVVRLLVGGMSVSEAATHLHRSIKTISTQKINAMNKLGIKSDSELFEYAKNSGLV
ncbi:response regulator [Aeromonas dhakensis]|uniref:response regulator n=1 Tax=Aeromonas dhakensis TaxID=196024 RepID=UPI00398747B2